MFYLIAFAAGVFCGVGAAKRQEIIDWVKAKFSE